jgi:thiol-disulfide isomerase/thioredoxin
MRLATMLSRDLLSVATLMLSIAVGCGPEMDSQFSALPQYKFKVGQELIYRVTSDETFSESGELEQKDYGAEGQWHVYPIRQDEAGTWRLFIRRSYKSFRWPSKERSGDLAYWIRRGIREGGIPRIDEPQITFQNEFMGYCDLRPDGTFEENDSLGSNAIFRLQPEELFCRLPQGDKELRSGWNYTSLASKEHYAFSPLHGASSDSSPISLIGKVTTPEDANYGLQVNRTFTFDSKQGTITRIERQASDEYNGKKSRFLQTIELVSQEQHDDQWVAAFAKEAAEYIAADRQWWNVLEDSAMTRTRADCEASMSELRKDLVHLQDQANLPELRELYAMRLELLDDQVKNILEEAVEREEIYARPPFNWETTDFADQPQRLVDYRGKVVVMDFWYRGCAHCIRALPKVKQVEAKYADLSVAVLGVNIDKVDEDASYVINTYELKYPIVRGTDISKNYGVNVWPTFVVLDQSGRVALILTGNRDNLVGELSEAIDSLLANPVVEVTL